MNTRCKVICSSVTDHGETKSVLLHPVSGATEEDKSFFKWTPGGEIRLDVLNPDVKFIPGKKYYMDLSEAE